MRRSCRLFLILLTAFCLLPGTLLQSQSKAGDTRKKAFELFQQNRHLEALPLFEELAIQSPDDRDVLLGLGVCLISHSSTLDDSKAAARERLRARKLLLKSKSLGQTSALLENMLQTIPENGEVNYQNTPADQAMKAAEAAFSRRDFDEAIKQYSKVLEYDPKRYAAVLFIGDTYFQAQNFDKAGQWYQRAIDLDPNRETAHRYYADMLLKNGDITNSRTRFIQAVVAEPYNPITWRGLKYWAESNKLQLQRVHIDVPDNVKRKDDKNITINMDPRMPDDASSTWLIYGMVKASWQGDEFKKHFPQEAKYRHSLDEEAAALDTAATVLSENGKDKKKKSSSGSKDPNLALLAKLHDAKMLEPYVLLSAPDDGIAADYAAYRTKNREKLEQYLSDFIVPPAP